MHPFFVSNCYPINLSPFEDALQALRSLGFTANDAQRALSKVQSSPGAKDLDSGGIVKEALKFV